MEPSMEVIATPGAISGTGVIDDLLNRIAAQLERSCDLRASDCYTGYAARVRIDLQLHDVYAVEATAQVAVGSIDPTQPSQRITLGPTVQAEAEPAPGSLERPVDPAGITTEAPARQYVSRIRGRRG
jgi:hypothetical protein